MNESIANKLKTIAENEPKVYEAGYAAGLANGGGGSGELDLCKVTITQTLYNGFSEVTYQIHTPLGNSYAGAIIANYNTQFDIFVPKGYDIYIVAITPSLSPSWQFTVSDSTAAVSVSTNRYTILGDVTLTTSAVSPK